MTGRPVGNRGSVVGLLARPCEGGFLSQKRWITLLTNRGNYTEAARILNSFVTA
jgi:hypothetical protein